MGLESAWIRAQTSRGRAASPDDAELVAAVNAGSHAAFETLYHRHRDWAVNIAFRFTGDEALALDVKRKQVLFVEACAEIRIPGLHRCCNR